MSLHVNYLRQLPPKLQNEFISSLTEEEAEFHAHHWPYHRHDNQITPDWDWQTWLFLAGRGAGKTRCGAEFIREEVKCGASYIALIAPTAGDARDVMVEGESGLLSVCWDKDQTHDGKPLGRPLYEPSKRRLTWQNGAQATLFSAEEPERLRGPQHGVFWADEVAAWKRLQETWDMLQFGLRLGDKPRGMVTTTPKPLKLIRELRKDPKTAISTGSTFVNSANLADTFLKAIKEKYEGTRLGRQELYAELLDQAEGALWTREILDAALHKGELPDMKRVVVAVDPAITAKAESDETGIVVCGLGEDDLGYVLEDVSGRYTPGNWAKKVIRVFDKWNADKIVAEGNQGGEMVSHTIKTERKTAPVKIVHASRGKYARAEPVAALYEQNRVRHVTGLSELEDQLTNWEPLSGVESPDKLDAMVWGLTELMIGHKPQRLIAEPPVLFEA